MSDDRLEELRPLILAAWNRPDKPTARSLEKEFHTGHHLVQRVLREAGINPNRYRRRGPSRQRAAAEDNVLAAWTRPDAPPIMQVAKEAGVSTYLVRQILLEAGYDTAAHSRSGRQKAAAGVDETMRAQILAAWGRDDCPPMTSIARELGVPRKHIAAVLQATGADTRRGIGRTGHDRYPATTPALHARVLQEWEPPEATVASVAEAVGVPKSRVTRILHNAGIDLADKRRQRWRAQDEAIVQAWNAAEHPTIESIAAETGINPRTVSRVSRDRGLVKATRAKTRPARAQSPRGSRQRPPQWTQEELEAMAQAWRAPDAPTDAALAEQFSLNAHQFRQALQEAGVNVRAERAARRAARDQARTAAVTQAWHATKHPTIKTISQALGLPYNAVTHITRAEGLTYRPRAEEHHDAVLSAWNRPDKPSTTAISRELGVSRPTVVKILEAEGIDSTAHRASVVPSPPVAIDPAAADQARHALVQAVTATEEARQRSNAALQQLKQCRKDRDRALRDAYRSGLSREELATIAGLSPATVRVFANTKH